MYALAEFPSQGDLIKFTYDALGVIPSQSEQILDLKIENKSFQKSLQRLANEESSNYLENFDSHIQAFTHAITDLFPSYQYHNSLLDILKEFFQCYLATVLDNHTYLEKKKSFEFIIFSTLLPRLPISILKHKESYADFFQKTQMPKDFYWFLGSKEQTPLTYIMKWIYNSEKLPHEEFHTLLSSQLKDNEDNQDEKDLWNIPKWLSNKSLPAFNHLKAVFERAFKSHAVPKERQESYLFFLLIARFCTYCIHEIKSKYSEEFLDLITIKLKAYLDAIYKDFHLFYNDEMKSAVLKEKNTIENHPYSKQHQTNVDEMLNYVIFESFSKNCLQTSKDLALHFQHVGHANDFPDFDNSFPANFNLITLKDGFRYLQSQANPKPFLVNIENYHHGYVDVLNKKMSFEIWLSEYKTCQNHIVYPWLEQWIRGVLAFKRNDITEALNFMDSAFETIRYAAGKHQERFLEDYLLISLSNPKGFRSFKKAYKWGTFMNHFGGLKPLFNLTSDEEIKQLYQAKKDNFKVFEKMKNNMDMSTLTKVVFHWGYDQD
jgi:hypothetical protein